MHHSPQHRLRPASIVPLVSLIILLGTAAWAEVTPLARPHTDAFTAGLVASLSQPSDMDAARTATLRTDLLKAHHLDLLVHHRARTTWDRHGGTKAAVSQTPAPVSGPVSTAPIVHSSGANWSAIAQCESSGVWSANTGNGYWGGLQFAPSTWFAYGGGAFDGQGPFPYSASTQIAVAERVLAAQGPGAWPNCFVWG
jgi:hypothetical protein